jgi:ketosteroid isomerase-like protein
VGEQENREAVERMIRAINDRNLDLMDAQFHEDSVMEYPQSGERIVGGENRRAVYGAFPGLPTFTTRRILVSGDVVVVQASLSYGDGVDHRCVFIFELREGKISRETGYWAQPFEAAEWRAPWVERMEA